MVRPPRALRRARRPAFLLRLALLAIALAGSGCQRSGPAAAAGEVAARPAPTAVGLFTTLPLLWPERERLGELLRGPERPHWALAAMRAEGRIVALDHLIDPATDAVPGDVGLLVLAPGTALAAVRLKLLC